MAITHRYFQKVINGFSLIINNGRFLTLGNFIDQVQTLPYGMVSHDDCLIAPAATGLHDSKGQPIVESYLRRDSGRSIDFPLGKPSPIQVPAEQSLGQLETVIFIPKVFLDHFGHMLTETAGWLSPLLDPEVDGLQRAGPQAVILLGRASEGEVGAFCRLLNLPQQRVVSTLRIGSLTRCRLALIPQPSCINRHAIHEKHCRAVRHLVNRWYGLSPEVEHGLTRIKTTSAKIYLSRSKLPEGTRKIWGEEDLEKELAAQGWQVVYPETLSIVDQLALLKSSRIIAGNIGSAFHLLMYFGTDVSDKTVIGLGMVNGQMNPNFSNQFYRQSLSFYHLCCLRHIRSDIEDLRLTLPPRAIAERMAEVARQALATVELVSPS